jgi:hypothetical protein
MRTLSLTLALLATTTLSAADEPDYGSGDVLHPDYFGGMRLDVGTAPGVKKTVTSRSTDQTGTADPQADGTSNLKTKNGFALALSVYWDSSLDGGWGWVSAPGLFYRNVVGTSNNYRDTFTALGIEFATGPSYTWDHLNLELMPYIGVAGCNLNQQASINGVSGDRHTGTGNDIDYGIKLAANYLFQGNVYLGVTGGYEVFHAQARGISAESKQGLLFDAQRIEVDGNGIIGFVTLGFWY